MSPHVFPTNMIIGVTGGMGSGKTALSKMLADLGAASVVDADSIAHKVVGGEALLHKLVEAFGHGIATSAGTLDRRELGSRALADRASLNKLNTIIRPQLESELRCQLSHVESASRGGIILFDAPLIFEWGIEDWVDAIVLVDCAEEVRIQRVIDRSGLGREEIQRRMALQMGSADKKARADFVIDNSGTIEELRRQAEKLWHHLVGLIGHRGKR